MKNVILLDLDGTITDPKVGITKSVQYALSHFDIHVADPDELCHFIGPPLRESFREFYGLSEEDAELATAKYRERFAPTGVYENEIYDGMKDLLKNLKESGRTLILATSKPTVFAVRVLEYFDIAEYFSFISGSELSGERSDKFEVITYALEKCGISDLDSCVMIGDRKFDIIGAKAVGISCIGVLYGYGDEAELSEAGADYLASDVLELAQLLNGGLDL